MKPGLKKTVYADTSSLILLYKADLLPPLTSRFNLVLADAVFREITRPGYEGAGYFGRGRDFQVRMPGLPCPGELGNAGMDAGETQTLALYLEADFADHTFPGHAFILVDDGKAARYCKAHGLPFINALLVPKVFMASGLMAPDACSEKMTLLLDLGRYSRTVREKALSLGPGDLTLFLPEIAQ